MQKNIAFLVIGIGVLVVFAFVAVVIGSLRPKGPSQEEIAKVSKPVTLTYWRVFDGDTSIRQIITAYQRLHTNVKIDYRKLRFEEYEREIVNALAEDRGPDIFSIHNTWVDRYLTKIEPLPGELKVASFVEKGTIQKKTEVQIDKKQAYTPREIREKFVDVVGSDVLRFMDGKEQVVGLPYFVDVLALFYNKDSFNNAGIGAPPRNWGEFQNMAGRDYLTQINDTTGEIVSSAAAIGGSKNIQRAADILAMLMMQNGAQMTDGAMLTFDQVPQNLTDRTTHPAVNALTFYTDFASPATDLYTWSEDFSDSFEMFQQGLTAMMFGYSYHAQALRDLQPRLRYGIVPVPQLNPSQQAVPANYWVETVSKKTKSKDYAWDFLMFATAAEQAKLFLAETKKPTALRELIEEQKKEEILYPFASQLLVAKNWFHGKNAEAMEAQFTSLIAQALQLRGGAPEEQKSKFRELLTKTKQIIQEGY
ncbi:extracellular solute-binding protein [Candidatus Uhrbacteria bacterium]|nr:extracellular solute-binding protein [Candidatus Uhrbacteria bacterium]